MRPGRPTRSSIQGADVGTTIVARRRDAGMTRTDLASKAGLSLNTLMKIEQGRTRDPGVLKVAALCRALSTPMDELIRDAESKRLRREVPTMANGIVSAGYEGRSIDEFVAQLLRAGVRVVADVRLNAISRKAGFSKTRLREALASAGIDYRHMRSLGNERANREPFRERRFEEGQRVYRRTLRSPEAAASLKELSDLVRDQVVAVLCFETDAEMCHRTVVIDEVVSTTSVSVETLPQESLFG